MDKQVKSRNQQRTEGGAVIYGSELQSIHFASHHLLTVHNTPPYP